MDFVYYGGYSVFLHVRDTFFTILWHRFYGGQEKDEQTAEMARCKGISNLLSAFVAPAIIAVSKDSGFTGGFFQDFCTSRNIALQAVIPGHHQISGGTARWRGHFRTTIDHMIGNKKSNFLEQKERVGFPAMATMRLNSQVRKFVGFAPGQRAVGMTQKMPIGASGNPHFEDFMDHRGPERPKRIIYFRRFAKLDKHR